MFSVGRMRGFSASSLVVLLMRLRLDKPCVDNVMMIEGHYHDYGLL